MAKRGAAFRGAAFHGGSALGRATAAAAAAAAAAASRPIGGGAWTRSARSGSRDCAVCSRNRVAVSTAQDGRWQLGPSVRVPPRELVGMHASAFRREHLGAVRRRTQWRHRVGRGRSRPVALLHRKVGGEALGRRPGRAWRRLAARGSPRAPARCLAAPCLGRPEQCRKRSDGSRDGRDGMPCVEMTDERSREMRRDAPRCAEISRARKMPLAGDADTGTAQREATSSRCGVPGRTESVESTISGVAAPLTATRCTTRAAHAGASTALPLPDAAARRARAVCTKATCSSAWSTRSSDTPDSSAGEKPNGRGVRQPEIARSGCTTSTWREIRRD